MDVFVDVFLMFFDDIDDMDDIDDIDLTLFWKLMLLSFPKGNVKIFRTSQKHAEHRLMVCGYVT